MILSLFAFLLGLSGIASFALFATDGEKLWNWIILFLGLAYPFIALRYLEFPDGYIPSEGSELRQMIIYSLESAFSTHLVFLFAGVVLGILWVFYQEGTLDWFLGKQDESSS